MNQNAIIKSESGERRAGITASSSFERVLSNEQSIQNLDLQFHTLKDSKNLNSQLNIPNLHNHIKENLISGENNNTPQKSSLKKGLSIVMPCLNEEKTLAVCINKAKNSLKSMNIDGEVIIADNGSTDNSISIAKECGARVVNVREKGYGSALRGGIAAAEYEYVIMGDADDSYDFSNISQFVQKLDEGFELVMGNRFKGGIEPGAMSFSHKYIGNPFLSGLGRLFFRTKIGDFHCGLRAFRKDKIEELGLCTTGMEFASEMVVKSVLFKLKITEVPCKLFPDGRDRPPHLRSIPDGLRHLEFLLLYSPKWLFVYPGIFLFAMGLLFTILIYIQPLHIGRIQFEVTSMLYSALAMLIGMQMLQFATFTGLFAERIGQMPESSGFIHKISNFFIRHGYKTALCVMTAGLAGIIYTLVIWSKSGFGQLNNTLVCRTAILFGSLFAMGIEFILFTLFTKVLRMGKSNNSH